MIEFSNGGIVVSKEKCDNSIEWLNQKPLVMDYLREHGYQTVRDVLKDKNKLPKYIIRPVLMKVFFDKDNYNYTRSKPRKKRY